MTQEIRYPTLRARGRETGSAYIVTLLALVVLTIIGLSLSLVGQTERELGVNEVNTQRIFYAANSGIGASTARALGIKNYNRLTYINAPTPVPGSSLQAADRVQISRFYQISFSAANATELGELYNVHYALTATAQRVFWDEAETLPDGDDETRSTQIVGEMVTVQPWEASTEEVLLGLEDLEEYPGPSPLG